jgi:hypothetical protein
MRFLAERLLEVELGARIPRTVDIASELSVGFGTVEKALTVLRDEKVIKTRSRGQKGTFLVERDLSRQWKAAGLGTVIGLLPLPNAMPFIGLATGVTAWFEATGIPFAINFKNGVQSRLAALTEGRADLVAMSKRSAETACAREETVVTVMELPPSSYYVGHEIIYRRGCRKDRSSWRIGVDRTSYDHVEVCEAVFPRSPRQELRYVHLPYAIAKGEIDASVVHSRSLVPMEVAALLEAEPAQLPGALAEATSTAVLLARRDNRALRVIVERLGGAAEIHSTQRAVMNRQREPEF